VFVEFFVLKPTGRLGAKQRVYALAIII